MITGLNIASAASLARVYGFDGKFVLSPGFKFTFAAGEVIYEENSGFSTKNEDGTESPIMTIFVARENAGKIEGLTLGALTRTTLPGNAQINPMASKYIAGFVNDPNHKGLVTDRLSARQLVDSLAGRTIELQAIIAYNAVSAKGKAYTGKQYIWK